MRPHEQLELEWAKFNDLDPAGMVACSSGTAALHLALEALQLPPDSEVIVPDFTMVACPRAVAMAELRPVFVDCDERLLIDRTLVHDVRLTDMNVKAIMMVHVYGRRCDLWRYSAIQGWFIIEDMAEIHGVKPSAMSDAACWSFYKNKIVAGEEGGAVWFRDPEHASLARQLRSLGFTDAHDYRHVPRGHNYRMSDAHASLILDNMMGPLDVMIPRDRILKTNERREIESWYDETCPAEWRQPPRDVVWVYDLRIPNLCESVQDEIVRRLRANKIEARHGFKPMHEMEEFRDCRRVGGENVERASREVVYLPVNPGVTTRADAVRAFELIRSIVPRT